jgi:hypothetical protein
MNIIEIANEAMKNKKLIFTRPDWKERHTAFVFPAISEDSAEAFARSKNGIDPELKSYLLFACNIEGVLDRKGIQGFAPVAVRLVDLLAVDWEIIFQ